MRNPFKSSGKGKDKELSKTEGQDPPPIIDNPKVEVVVKQKLEDPKPTVVLPSELVIKEMMVQKNCTREKAVEILKNPAK
jgi:hypothetical protein